MEPQSAGQEGLRPDSAAYCNSPVRRRTWVYRDGDARLAGSACLGEFPDLVGEAQVGALCRAA
jgi:hypothetical protein